MCFKCTSYLILSNRRYSFSIPAGAAHCSSFPLPFLSAQCKSFACHFVPLAVPSRHYFSISFRILSFPFLFQTTPRRSFPFLLHSISAFLLFSVSTPCMSRLLLSFPFPGISTHCFSSPSRFSTILIFSVSAQCMSVHRLSSPFRFPSCHLFSRLLHHDSALFYSSPSLIITVPLLAISFPFKLHASPLCHCGTLHFVAYVVFAPLFRHCASRCSSLPYSSFSGSFMRIISILFRYKSIPSASILRRSISVHLFSLQFHNISIQFLCRSILFFSISILILAVPSQFHNMSSLPCSVTSRFIPPLIFSVPFLIHLLDLDLIIRNIMAIPAKKIVSAMLLFSAQMNAIIDENIKPIELSNLDVNVSPPPKKKL